MSPTEISKFTPNADKEFDSSIARQLAELIQQSYVQFDKAQLRHQGGNITSWEITGNYELIAKLGTEVTPFGFIAQDPIKNNVFVVFRGTKKIVEWF